MLGEPCLISSLAAGGSITKYRDLHPRLLNPAGEISFRLTILLITDTNSRHCWRDQNQLQNINLIEKVLKRIQPSLENDPKVCSVGSGKLAV